MNRTPPLLLLFGALLSLNGCYLLKQGTYLLSYSARARPIEKVLAGSPGSPGSPEVEEMLLSVQEIRLYATEVIGLQANRNYTRYLELDRDYVVDVVTACRADRAAPKSPGRYGRQSGLSRSTLLVL